jgi:metal-dependent hydrolase (beta-lactamase superfamily II)
MALTLKEVDKLEILTLQDNYIDVAAMDSTEMVHWAMPLKDGEIKKSILAEHGFSALVSVFAGNESRSILFDFGFSKHGAAYNADALDPEYVIPTHCTGRKATFHLEQEMPDQFLLNMSRTRIVLSAE